MSNNRLIVTILVLVLILVGVGWFLTAKGLMPGSNQNAQASSSGYHAVFLSNGQVYFGKMSSQKGQYANLEDIFYLQVQQAEGTQGQQNQQNQEQPNVSLVKLGNELHGPVDEMSINRDHIIFIEQMKSDSKVVEAIEKYKKDGPQQPQQQQTQVPAASPSPAGR